VGKNLDSELQDASENSDGSHEERQESAAEEEG
jgi:hypothetical protein